MSGKLLARTTALSLAVLLAACGGDDGSAPLASPGGSNSSGESGSDTGGSSGTDQEERVLALGSGEGDSFISGQLSTAPKSIPAGGKTILGLSIVNEAAGNKLLAGDEVSVEFTSRCISSGDSTLPSPVTTTSGLVEVEYQSNGCAGEDTITASYEGATAQSTISIEAASPFSLFSNPPSPESIAPVGNSNSSRPSTSVVTFTIIDENDIPVRGAEVSFQLSYSERAIPDVEDARLDKESTISGPGGEATVRVRAGQQNTVVRVIASITRENGTTVSVPSAPISINSFLPDQDSFSMSISNFMPNAQNYNNQTVEVTINGGDRFNNNDIADGNAVVNFVTSGGSIDNYCVLDDNGTCTVTWVSTDPRPANGRVAILARTVGDESFKDLNSNDEFDNGEFVPDPGVDFEKGEAFLDYDADQNYSASVDQFFDNNGDLIFNGPDGIYDGSACLSPDANNCSPAPTIIWDQGYIVMASDTGIVGQLSATGTPNQYCLAVNATTQAGQDVPLPSGTTVDFQIQDGNLLSTVTSFTVSDGYQANDIATYCVDAEEDDDLSTVTRLSATVTPPSPYGGSPLEFSIIL